MEIILTIVNIEFCIIEKIILIFKKKLLRRSNYILEYHI
jgi:hypothetical protein